MKTKSFQTAAAEWCLRLALSTAFLSAVADRFGLWGGPGSPNVSWGDWEHFLVYSGKLNAWLPPTLQTAAAWIATVMEVVLGIGLLVPCRTRWWAVASGVLLTIFAMVMSFALGPKAPLNYSVWTAAGGAFLLAANAGNKTTAGKPERKAGESNS
jgi:uncharacterized membrane protein YphA (DoxX/SURF4 family)